MHAVLKNLKKNTDYMLFGAGLKFGIARII